MIRFKGFTFWGKKERILGMMVVLAVVMLLSGCGANAGEINAQTPGFFNHYVVFPLSWLIQQLARWFDGSFGLAIMTLTLIVRLALLPLMMRQTRAQQGMKRKMSAMQPDLDRIKKKYENKKDAASQQSMQQEMMALYKEHQFNPLNIGCLPILIQLPILSGMYTAIRLTPELASHSFLWFRLGQPDWILAIIVAVVYLAQAKLSQLHMTAEQRKQMAIMGYLSPIMMAVFSFNAPAAMPLYWTVGGTFLLLQSLWFRKRYPTEEAERKPELGEATST